MGLAEGAQSLLDQGHVGQHPAVQGGVVDLQAALQKQLLDVTIAERVAEVPRDGLQDQRRLEVAALEVVLGPALQLLDKGVQDHRPPPPVRRRLCRPQAQRAVNAKTLRQGLKETERRAARFEERHGEGGTDLDALEALPAGALDRILRREVERYYDGTLWT